MSLLRREPFRLLFPLGALLALAGVLPWLLFGTGLSRLYLGVYHAFTMTQAFLIAVAAGFLGTMLPRRTGAAPLSPWELALMIGALASIPAALLVDRVALAEFAYLVAVGTLAQFALRWTLMFDAVSCAIPGAKTVAQASDNAAAAGLPALSPQAMAAVQAVYDEMIRPLVHESW